MNPSLNRQQFRTDINGLRALAVIAVMMFHYDVPGFAGGFIGVDIFFVISGFLMTQIICAKMLATGGAYSVADFYRARVRRIVPALAGLTVVLLSLGSFFLIPVEYAALGRNALSALLFVSNIVFWRSSGYFDTTASHDNWLLHTWSLSLEWQFYLMLPWLLLALHRFRDGRYLRVTVLLLAALSLVLSGSVSASRPGASFYLLPTRCWELFAGGIAYFYQQRLRPRALLDIAALATIGACVWLYSGALAFPGYWALPPVAATALLLAAGSKNRLLNNPPMQFLGEISYSLYLWHWPLMVGLQYLDLPVTPITRSVLVVMAVLLAALSYRFIETPFRKPRRAPATASVLGRAAAPAVFAVATLASLAIFLGDGLPLRLPADKRATIIANQARVNDWDYPIACQQNYKKKFSLTTDSAPVYCPIGPAMQKHVLFWGDSMVEQLYPALLQLSASGTGNAQIIMATSAGCIPIRKLNRLEADFDCAGFNEALFARARADDIETVVLAGSWKFSLGSGESQQDFNARPCPERGHCDSFPSSDAALAFAERQLSTDIATLTTQGKRVILILPFPQFGRSVALTLARGALDGRALDFQLTRQQHLGRTAAVARLLRRVAQAHGASLIEPADVLCPEDECAYQRNGVALYRDGSHLVPEAARWLLPTLANGVGYPVAQSNPR